MLIQIDVYPDNSIQSSQTLYASLANIVNNRSGDDGQHEKKDEDDDHRGRLVTLGRKGTDVVFPKEKAISRNHAVILCVASAGAGCLDGCIEARNEEESLACERSPYHMCLVLENLGKAGSFVATPVGVKKPETEPKREDQNDDDETDDETDDEGIVSQQQQQQQQQGHPSQAINTSSLDGQLVPPLSRVTQELYGTDPVKLTKVDVGKNHILPLGTNAEDESHTSSVVAIQFANACNTVKITWIPLNFVFSNTPDAGSLRTSLFLCGGLTMDLPRVERTTHLVTNELIPVGKQLISWCLGIPMVTPEFVKAHIRRKALTDPLPNANDYLAKTKTPISGNANFWTLKPNRELLSRYVLLSIDPNESERLAESAGTHVESLYAFDTEDLAMKHAQELLERHRESNTVCFCIETTKSSRSKASSLYRKLTHELGVPSIPLKDLAKAICQQSSTLYDSRGQKIGMSSGRVHFAVGTTGSAGSEEEEGNSFGAASQTLLSEPVQDINDVNEDNNNHDEEIKLSSTKDKTSEIVPVLSTKVREENVGEKEQAMRAGGMSKDGETNNAAASEGSAKLTNRPLGTSDSNGWFTVAPKDDKTRTLLRQQASVAYEKANGVSLERAAPTGVGAVRIFAVTPPPQSSSSQENETPNDSFSSLYGISGGGAPGTSRTNDRNNAAGGIPNFKKFRKNVVPPKSSSTISRIVLREFVPEKTEKQRQMDEQQQELEEEQRLADALFRGDGTVGPKKRRRA